MITRFFDYITGRGSVKHTLVWFGTAICLTAYAAYETIMSGERSLSDVLVFSITALLGYLSVVALAFRKPSSGNVFGMTANVGEMYSQFQFRNLGMVFSAAYYLCFHIIGLLTWTKKENQDAEGLVKTTKTNIGFIVFTILAGVVGCVVLYYYGSRWGLVVDDTPTLFYLNILAFIIGILSQMAMILRKAWSWHMWLGSNLIWFTINYMSGNYIFMIQSVLYEWNCVLAIYIWNKESRG